MSEMIERVALAVKKAAGGDLNHSDSKHLARAAIEAMREPTSYMIATVAAKPGQQTYGDVWRAMIDEARK